MDSRELRSHPGVLGAAFRGDLWQLRKLLQEHPNALSVGTETGERPLHLAAYSGNLEAVEFLVKRGADVFARNDFEDTCLHFAAWGGSEAVVEYFVRAGIPIDVEDDGGQTPVFWAAAGGHVHLVDWFAARGIDVTVPSRGGWTPLHAASGAPSDDAARRLVEHYGARLDARDQDNRSPLFVAATFGRGALADWLYERDSSVAVWLAYHHWTLLHAAVFGRCTSLVRTLLAAGADPNVRDAAGQTPLMGASKRPEVRLLLGAGADINAIDSGKQSTLHHAYSSRRIGVLRELIRSGADLAARDARGQTVLDLALVLNNRRTLRVLQGELEFRAQQLEAGPSLQ